jgi:biopolymer transport protein ExbD
MSRRLFWLGGVGIALILIGIALLVGFDRWIETRNWVALDMPISMAPGHIRSPEFEIDLEGEYWIYVDVERQFKPDVIDCLLGVNYGGCENQSSIVRTSWRVTNAGKEIARDHNPVVARAGPYDRVGRTIGSFAADRSKHYVLDLDILADASELNGGHPRLKVEELGGAYQRYMALGENLISVVLLLVAAGAVLVIVALVGWARERDRWRLQLTSVGPQPRELFFGQPAVARSAGDLPRPEEKRLPLSFWLGALLFCIGVASFSSIAIWLNTRNWVPLDMPVSMARGHIGTEPFKVNVRARYDINVDSESVGNCFWYDRVKTTWSLYRNGVHVKDFSDPSPYASLGSFDGEGGIYALDLQINSDTGCLDAGHPRLRISTERYAFEEKFNPWMWLSAFSVPCGLSLVVLGCIARFRKERDAASELTGEASVGQNFQWAQKLALRQPFTGLPPFGLVAGLVYVVFVLSMRLVDTWAFEFHHPRGFYVRTALPDSIGTTSNTLKRSLVIRIEAGKPGEIPKLYLNDRPIAWSGLATAVQREIGRASESTVYVTADNDARWADATNAMDVARGLGCKVVLLSKAAVHRH